MISSRPCKNSSRLRHSESSVYASATRSGSRVFHASCAARTFAAAVSAVKGGRMLVGLAMSDAPLYWSRCSSSVAQWRPAMAKLWLSEKSI